MKNEETNKRIGSLFLGIRNYTKWQALYSVVYLLRRLAFVCVLVFIEDMPSIVVILVMTLNMMFIVYLGEARPHNSTTLHKVALFNEWTLQIITYHLIITWFTTGNFLDSPTGWSFIGFVSFLLGVNITFILLQTLKSIWERLKLKKQHREFIKHQ